MKKTLLALLFFNSYAHSIFWKSRPPVSCSQTHHSYCYKTISYILPKNSSTPSILSTIAAFSLQGLKHNQIFKLKTTTIPYARDFFLETPQNQYKIEITLDKLQPRLNHPMYPFFHNHPFFDITGDYIDHFSDDAKRHGLTTALPTSTELTEVIRPASEWMTHEQFHQFSQIVHGTEPGEIRFNPAALDEAGKPLTTKMSDLIMEYSDMRKRSRK